MQVPYRRCGDLSNRRAPRPDQKVTIKPSDLTDNPADPR